MMEPYATLDKRWSEPRSRTCNGPVVFFTPTREVSRPQCGLGHLDANPDSATH